MQLSPEQTARFYRIWLTLLRYVNEEQHLVPAFSPAEEEAPLPLSDEMQLRDALWANDGLRTHGTKTVTTSFKRFVRFLEETGRMDYEQAEVLREWLKQTSA